MGSCACSDSHERKVRKLQRENKKLLEQKELLELEARNEILASNNVILKQAVTNKGSKTATIEAQIVDPNQVITSMMQYPQPPAYQQIRSP